jgi:hypothetical protein
MTILIRAGVAAAILCPWLFLITLRQTALFDGSGGGPPRPGLLATPVTLAVMAAALVLRLLRPTVAAHVVCLAVMTCGLALLAAQLGGPLANATADYCGDQCRTAIMGRLLSFAGWPLVGATGLLAAWAWERRRPEPGAAERALWSHAWIYPTLLLGLAWSISWWRIILP